MRKRAILLALFVAVLTALVGASSARSNHGYVMPFDTFQPRGWDKYHDSNRLLRARCRPTFDGMRDFAGKPLSDVLRSWRHVKIDRLRAKRERQREKSSTCSPVELGRTIAATEYGWGADQFVHLFDPGPTAALWERESGWQPCRRFPSTTDCGYGPFPSGGGYACGLPQFVPCSKLIGYRRELGDVPIVEQIRKGYNYIRDRYGTPAAADYFQLTHNYY